MKQHWIEYNETRPVLSMTFWVHRKVAGKPWFETEEFDPPRQKAVPLKGYPVFKVEFNGFTFEFTSFAEIQVCIKPLQEKLLPWTIDLSYKHGTGTEPNSHWLSRLPADVKSWKYREKAVEYLKETLEEFKKEID